VAGVLCAKLLNVISGGKVNPLVGAAGISAFPMAARVVQKVASDEDFDNFLLMHAMGANAAGQIASVVAGGVLLALMGAGAG
jgi:carboxybiotin decarboxylase